MANADLAPTGAPGALDPQPPGTLPEPQVRAMFDRIAGVYDLMNSVMTAGLHHQWRRRAADLARVAPGDRVLDVATGTGDLALELAAPRRDRRARWSELTSPSGCSSWRAPRPPNVRDADVRFERPTRSRCRIADDEFDAATVGFGARNFSDLQPGSRRWRGW